MKSFRHLNIIFTFAVILSIGMMASAQEVFRRGLEQITFVPKGQWITGVSVSYSQSDQDTALPQKEIPYQDCYTQETPEYQGLH